MIAVAASKNCQKNIQTESVTLFGRGASATRMMAMATMKMERPNTAPMAILRRRSILTRQSVLGIDMMRRSVNESAQTIMSR